MDSKSYTLKNADFSSVAGQQNRRSPLKASKKLGAMYSPTEIDPNKVKNGRASPAGAPIGYNQSVGIMPAGANYLDTKVAVRKPI